MRLDDGWGYSHDAPAFDIDNADECMEKACLPFAECQAISYSPVLQDCATYTMSSLVQSLVEETLKK